MPGRQTKVSASLPLLGLCLLLSGCSATQKVAVNQDNVNCAFLAHDCALLTTGGKDQAGMRYVNPSAQGSQYNKVMIDPVTFWGDSATSISASDQHMLVNYFSQQLNKDLGQKFQVVTQPGPGVMQVDVAIVDATSATPVLRSISMIIPQAHLLSTLKYMATGSYPFVGGAQAEVKITDSVSGQILALAVDKRIGGGSITTGFQWQWGDAENVVNVWSEEVAKRLFSWTSGSVAQ
jgi:hypothetical protein